MTPFGLAIVGGAGLLLSVLGLLYNVAFAATILWSLPVTREIPYLRPAAVTMVGISTLVQVALLVICVALCSGESTWAYALVSWTGGVCAYLLAIRMVSRVVPRSVRRSISAAFGVANTGLASIVFSAYPFWGPALALLLHWTA